MRHRILLNGEWSHGSSGYSKISKEVLNRLAATGKYELAEIACDCTPEEAENFEDPWKVYPIRPDKNDEEGIKEYGAHPANGFGRARFNPISLEFNQSINLDFRDFWYQEHEHISPYRRFFNNIWICPTDGIPLQNKWVDDLIDCEAIFSYTNWGAKVLKDQCGNKGNIVGSFHLGVNFEEFFPIWPKSQIKETFGFKSDSLVVGFVARNQYRKLFDDLFQAFVYFLQNAPERITSKTYLYLHTCWPDIGWDLPQLLMEYGISNKVLFTYYCRDCHNIFPSVYNDTLTICKHCGHPAATLPRVENAISEQQLNLIYNFFDVYIQLFTNEGFGIPCIESMAAACPTMTLNYSSTEDFIEDCGAIPLKVTRLRREPELGRLFAIPDIEDIAQKLTEILGLPDSIRRKIGFEQYQRCLLEYNWDSSVKKLMNVIDQMPIHNWADKNIRLRQPQLPIPDGLTNEQYVKYLYGNIMGKPEFINTYRANKLLYSLTMGWTGEKPEFSTIDRGIALQHVLGDLEYYNHWEQMRKEKFNL